MSVGPAYSASRQSELYHSQLKYDEHVCCDEDAAIQGAKAAVSEVMLEVMIVDKAAPVSMSQAPEEASQAHVPEHDACGRTAQASD